MRLAVLAVLLCASPIVLCQSAVPGLANPEQSQVAQLAQAWPMPTQLAPAFPPTVQRNIYVYPRPGGFRAPDQPRNSSRIDPQMIVQPPGTLVAQNIFPGLRLLPIGSAAALKPIPTDWPRLKIESIPIAWPKSTLLPIDSGSAASTPAPAK
jgi:hypothetical protein